MPFIGKSPTAGFASIVKDDLTPNGSTTAFTLSKQVANANDIAVFLGNVRQEPTDAYTVSGTTLTMSEAPASGLNFYVLHIAGTVESSVVPADGTITSAKIQNDAITGDKLANNIGALRNIQRFTSSGTYTPTSGTKHIYVIVTGGGASGAGYNSTSSSATTYHGGGGGAGGTMIGYLQGIDSSTYTATITVGAGATGATASVNGGNSIYNDGTRTLQGSGGGASARDSNTVVGGTRGGVGGGSNSSGTWNLAQGLTGGPGGNGFGYEDSVGVVGGEGGSSYWGGGGHGAGRASSGTTAGDDAPGANNGAGGGSCAAHHNASGSVNTTGGNGSDGVVVIYEYV